MQRDIESSLKDWKFSQFRSPLLLRGARQVGKTYTILKFGKENFDNVININFELRREYIDCFSSLDPKYILDNIKAISKQPIIPGETLLFLDEIQECPNAIMSLRYFKEQFSELHVIAAGSLLEFSINNEDFSMPVGRLHSMYLKPFSFKEYLLASGFDEIIKILSEITLDSLEINFAIHTTLEKVLREYFIVGGMPEAVNQYLNNKNIQQCQEIQLSLLNTFRNDFGKYASKFKHKYLQKIFEGVPINISQQFKFSRIDPHMQSRDLRFALEILKDAGLMYSVYCSKAAGLPLNALLNERKFKMLFLDIGLVKASSNISATIMLQKDLDLVNQGALSEQFVGQELLAYLPHYMPGQLFYWSRDKKGSSAEVDYVVNVSDKIIPVEVKSGKNWNFTLIALFY